MACVGIAAVVVIYSAALLCHRDAVTAEKVIANTQFISGITFEFSAAGGHTRGGPREARFIFSGARHASVYIVRRIREGGLRAHESIAAA
jgi:hypothetical protein